MISKKRMQSYPLQKLQRGDENEKQQLAWILVQPAYILETGSTVFSQHLGPKPKNYFSLLALKANKNNIKKKKNWPACLSRTLG